MIMLGSTTLPQDGMLKVDPLFAEALLDGAEKPREPWSAGPQPS